MTGEPPLIAVVGRQNVGKSTLVNRLFGRREAIAHEMPGVTRDRLEVETTWRGRRLRLVDTGGFIPVARGLDALVAKQTDLAAAAADLVLLVVDAQTGPTEDDAVLARRLRRSTAPVLLVANKVDSERDEADVAGFYSLGLGRPIGVSALHGRASGDLLDRIVQILPDAPVDDADADAEEPRFALVGRPNVGKSSLFNRLVGQDRSVVYEEAGTTRDSVDAIVSWSERPVRFVDTAGMRRPAKVEGLEYFSFLRATQAIERSNVAALVIDASSGFTSEDKRIAARIMERGRALLVVANKWDLVERKEDAYRSLRLELAPFERADVVRASALRGQGVHRIPPALLELHRRWLHRVSTSTVNDVLQAAQRERPTPRNVGVLHYATQVSAGPPSFVLFGGRAPDPAYRRYLENRFRREFGLDGVPVRMTFRPRRRGGERRRGAG